MQKDRRVRFKKKKSARASLGSVIAATKLLTLEICFQILTWLCSFLKWLHPVQRGNSLGNNLPETSFAKIMLSPAQSWDSKMRTWLKGEHTAQARGSQESRVFFVAFPQGHHNFDYVTFPLQLKARLTSRGSHLHFCCFASPAVLSDCFLQYYIMHCLLMQFHASCWLFEITKQKVRLHQWTASKMHRQEHTQQIISI